MEDTYFWREAKMSMTNIDRYAQDMGKTIWHNIEAERKRKSIDVQSLCKQAEISESVYYVHCRTAKRKTNMPDTSIDAIDRICHVLNKPLSYFMS